MVPEHLLSDRLVFVCVPPLCLIVMCTGCIHRLRFLLRTTGTPPSSTLHTTPSSPRTTVVGTPIYGLTSCHRVLPSLIIIIIIEGLSLLQSIPPSYPAYHIRIVNDVFRLWNSKKNKKIFSAHHGEMILH